MCSRKDLTEAILRNPDISFDEYGEEQNKMLGLLSYLFDCGKKIYVEKTTSSFDNKEELTENKPFSALHSISFFPKPLSEFIHPLPSLIFLR